MAARAAGLEYARLIERIVEHAVARHARRVQPVAVDSLTATD
jgi:hypothetical protein